MEPPKTVDNVKFVSSRFALPLFMVSRNRIKYTKFDEYNSYIKKKNRIYNTCVSEEFERATLKRLRQIVGITECEPPLASQLSRKVQPKSTSAKAKKSWQLPPNLYDTTKVPFIKKRGVGGAHWPKIHTHQAKPRPNFPQPHISVYTLPTIGERIFMPCNRAKGIFLTNARLRRATTRSMVSDSGGCYKDPSEPGPTSYNPIGRRTIEPVRKLKAPNPHIFYRSSVVPVKKNSIHPMHTSFTGAPGRYEIRYVNTCPCASRLNYQPQIELLIDIEKRKKFRRLAFEIIKARQYASPDWRHVKGRGFRYLFMGAKRIKQKPLTEQELKRQKTLQLYPDSKYISMINSPTRALMSFRASPLLDKLPQIKFNCMAKTITRKQLKSNKKIAFSTSQERFRDSYRLPVLTQKQQEAIKMTLPPDRQFRDHPIMNRRPSEIKPRLEETPMRLLPNYVPKLRKKNFKFLPLPEAKVLVTEGDTNVQELCVEGYYQSQVDPKLFFKDPVN